MGVPRVALTMSQLLTLVCCFLLSTLTARASYDSYQDALDKYAKWHQRHGLPSRVERNVEKNVVRDVFRNTRQQGNYQLGVGGAEYVTSDGTPLYKVKRRYPLGYGRRKRDVTSQLRSGLLSRTKRQWEVLDPSTGRTKPDPRYQEQNLDFYQQSLQSFRAPLARPERKTKRKTDAYITDSGEYLYRIKHRNPLGYSGRRRRNSDHEQKILIRVPRSA